MRTVDFDTSLYILPFDHRGSFQTKLFGWNGVLTVGGAVHRGIIMTFRISIVVLTLVLMILAGDLQERLLGLLHSRAGNRLGTD